MMIRVVLLAVSLLLNGASLALFALRPAIAPAPVRDFFIRNFRPAPPARPLAAKPAAARAARRPPLWSTLETGGDLPSLVARLRGAGFPAEVVRAIVLAEISALYDAKLRAFFEPDPNTPFWKLGSSFFSSGDKRMEQYSQLQRERAKLQRDLLADPFFASDDVTAAQRRQFGNLSRQQIDQVRRIEDDYSEMTAAIRAGTNGILLAEDREKLGLLQRERRADLATVLSPQELADYDMRSSPLTSMLSRQLASFNATEAEFRAIFQAQQGFGEKLGPVGPGGTNYEDRQAAQKQLFEQLKTSLGEARYADYLRETDRNYQQLVRLAEREKLPAGTSLQAYNVRYGVADESGRIADDPALSVDQKRAALQALAARTRNQLLGILGPNAGPVYVQLVEQQWLNAVQRGSAVSFNGTSGSMMMTMGASGSSGLPVTVTFGNSPTYRSVSQPPPSSAPPRP